VFLTELLMSFQGVAADAQHVGAALAKGIQIPLESD
jgi:hypothetical protein